MRKKLTVLLALMVLVFGLCGRVWAAEQPDPNRTGSITIVMEFDGAPLAGGSLTLYRVGSITPTNQFALVEPLSQDGPSLADLQDPGLAGTLNALAIAHGLEPYTAPIAEGRAVFSGLEPGLYVLSQSAGQETADYAPIDPFLMSLPQWLDDTYVYDLTAAPKVPLVPAPTEPTQPTEPPPTEPDTPQLPQTGQLNWPVPLMAVLGLTFFCLGWVLAFGSKRRSL